MLSGVVACRHAVETSPDFWYIVRASTYGILRFRLRSAQDDVPLLMGSLDLARDDVPLLMGSLDYADKVGYSG